MKQMTAAQLRVLDVLRKYHRAYDGRIAPSIPTIAIEASCSPRTARRALRVLELNEIICMIESEKWGRTTRVYEFCHRRTKSGQKRSADILSSPSADILVRVSNTKAALRLAWNAQDQHATIHPYQDEEADSLRAAQ